MTQRVLVLRPGKDARGGITNYFDALRRFLPPSVSYFVRGARRWPERGGVLSVFLRLIFDYLHFIIVLLSRRIDLVHLNTAFYGPSVRRDVVFLRLARLMGKKVVVFFRGWDDSYYTRAVEGKDRWFVQKLMSSDGIIVLAKKESLACKKIGYGGKVFQETTLVDDDLLLGVSSNYIDQKLLKIDRINKLLFLGRMEKTKGIYELLEAMVILKSQGREFELTMAGDGSELENFRNAIPKEMKDSISVVGFVSGARKAELFREAHIFVLPTYFEGLPNSILEAFSFGLPVLTRPVGGIPDIFENGRNGILCKTLDPKEIAEGIVELSRDIKSYREISLVNNSQSEYYLASHVSRRLVNIYNELLA